MMRSKTMHLVRQSTDDTWRILWSLLNAFNILSRYTFPDPEAYMVSTSQDMSMSIVLPGIWLHRVFLPGALVYPPLAAGRPPYSACLLLYSSYAGFLLSSFCSGEGEHLGSLLTSSRQKP